MIGNNIREIRTSQCISIRDLARITGIHKGILSDIERGIRVPSQAEVKLIEDIIGEVSLWVRVPVPPR